MLPLWALKLKVPINFCLLVMLVQYCKMKCFQPPIKDEALTLFDRRRACLLSGP